MLHKSCPAKVKAAGEVDGLDEGQFTAIVSVFGNVDSYGDVVAKGAFAETLKSWQDSGNPIPCYFSHRMDDPDYNIGFVLESKETDEGLWVKVQLDLDAEAVKARQVYRLLKGRRITQFSFAYDVLDGGWETKDGAEFYEIRKVNLYEVGPTPIGANQETDLLAVKAATEHATRFVEAVKAGRVLSAKNEDTLRAARDQLSAATQQIADVLSAVESTNNDEEKNAQPEQPENPREPVQPAQDDPTATSPAIGVDEVDAALAVLHTREMETSV